jgi:molybdenum cofactor cytidylyltransferase
MGIKIEGVILAAGFSSRTKTFKMELPFGNKILIERAIEGMIDTCSRIIVVGGHRIERIRDITKKYPTVQVVFNTHYERGMFSSVQAGVRHLKGDWFFIMPGDYPFITKHVFQKLKKSMETSDPGYDIFIPTSKGRKGHPVLIRKKVKDEILREPVDSTLKTVIHRNSVLLVEVDHEGILMDVNTMKDYERVKEAVLKEPG